MKRYTENINFNIVEIGKNNIKLPLSIDWVPKPFPLNPLYKRIQENFNIEHYLYPTIPLEIGRINIEIPNNIKHNRILRCLIKREDETELTIPSELEFLLPLIRHIVEFDGAINDSKQFFIHITFEQTYVKKGEVQRVPGWHVDGFQGVRNGGHLIEHSYLWTDNEHTEFAIKPFFISHLDSARHNIFDEMEEQMKNNKEIFQGMENHIYLIDPYIVHRSPVQQKDGIRNFVRITFSPIDLEDEHNTVNLSLEEKHHPNRIDVRDRFYKFEGKIPEEYYGVKIKK